ncbi:hypothetical protein [Alkalibacillus almallahensis]|uniref:hypothetical protein n=1 Tax=Alkalibacillus almallahensis TaxID=1379154 RepID=UPI0014205E5B|nr:hypothetical protein [Alkalibacillus almallahensis]NIK12847.1 excinuclease UvrABC ATPase subunit [Alkalibacillus almallahensis]
MCNGSGISNQEVMPGVYEVTKCYCEQCKGLRLREEPIEQTFKKWDAYIEQEQRMKGAV